jgi:hypothetical protein
MKKHTRGASLYYASDKNVFDALNQHKVDIQTIVEMFSRRNILVSRKTDREELSQQFSRMTHDHYDHQEIAQRLGVTQRRERTTSLVARNIPDASNVQAAIEMIKTSLHKGGDVVTVTRTDDRYVVNIKYTIIDYSKSEFTQIQHKDGEIELIRQGDGYVIRSTQNEYMNGIRDMLISNIEKTIGSSISREAVSMFDIQSPSLRSKFFDLLTSTLPDYTRRDLTDVYVYKPKPEAEEEDEESDEPHVEKVLLRGNGVGRSELFSELSGREYYVVKVTWIARELLGTGNEYVLEAAFSDVADCTNFSILVAAMFRREDGVLSKTRRPPGRPEIDAISRVIEKRAREIVSELRASQPQPDDANADEVQVVHAAV